MLMDLSLSSSVPRLVIFYAVLLLVFYPLCSAIDKLLTALRKRSNGTKRAD
jgi:hypothetical protein